MKRVRDWVYNVIKSFEVTLNSKHRVEKWIKKNTETLKSKTPKDENLVSYTKWLI